MLPLIAGAGAVALLGTSLGFDLSGDSFYQRAKDAQSQHMDQARVDRLVDSANTRRTISIGFAAAGVGCAGVAVWLYLRQRDTEPTATASHPSLIVSPTGMALIGAF